MLRPRTSPEPMPTLATVVLVEVQDALPVTSCLLPSLKVPVATNCTVPFLAMDAVPALKPIDCSVAVVPVRIAAGLAMLAIVAVICVVPAPWPTAVPVPEPIVATAVLEEAQVTSLVMSCVVPSLNVPMAVNCCVPPGATEVAAGEIAMDRSVAFVTVSVTAGLTMPVCVELDGAGPKVIGEPVACTNCVTAPLPWFSKMLRVLSSELTTARS